MPTKEAPTEGEQLGRDLGDEHREDRAVGDVQQVTVVRHHHARGLEAEGDRVDDDQGDDEALHAGRGDPRTDACAQAGIGHGTDSWPGSAVQDRDGGGV
jgi:hypothetical protein